MAFSSLYSRQKKPFNPLLGETWEYIKDDFKYIAEQVSHHPPITAYIGETPNYKTYGDCKVKTSLSLSGFNVVNLSEYFIEFNDNNDKFVFTRPKCIVKNLVMGTMYNYVYHNLSGRNLRTGDKINIVFKDKGWSTVVSP